MSRQNNRHDQAIQYLLGKLPDKEMTALEERFFSDEDVFEELEIAEDELVDRYLDNDLDAESRASFEKRIAASSRLQERVIFATVLKRKVKLHSSSHDSTSSPVVQFPAGRYARLHSRFFKIALAACLALVVLGGTLLVIKREKARESQRLEEAQRIEAERRRQDQESRTLEEQRAREPVAKDERQVEPKPSPAVEPKREASTVTLALFSGTSRSVGSGSNEVLIGPQTNRIRLTLNLDDTESRSYRATIKTPEGAMVQKFEHLNAGGSGPAKVISVQLPASVLGPGDYLVSVEGTNSAGVSEPIADYSFRVKK